MAKILGIRFYHLAGALTCGATIASGYDLNVGYGVGRAGKNYTLCLYYRAKFSDED